MTLSTTITESTHTGDNVQTTFAYAFKIQDDADLEVYLDGVPQVASGVYTVSGVGDETGGNVEFDVPPGVAVVILIKRNVRPLTQGIDLVTFGRNKVESIEQAIDRLYMAFQEIDQ